MDSPGAIVGVVIVAVLLLGALVGAQFAYASSGQTTTVNESVDTGAVGDRVVLNQSNQDGLSYSTDAAVVNASGVDMIPGSDFSWQRTNGTLTVDSERLANETGATVTYAYTVPTQSQNQVVAMLANVLGPGAQWVPLVMILGLVFLAFGVLGGLSS